MAVISSRQWHWVPKPFCVSFFLILGRIQLAYSGYLVGRPWLYGMAAGGQAGLEQVLLQTLSDLDTTLGLAGYQSLSEIQGKGEEVVTKLDFDL